MSNEREGEPRDVEVPAGNSTDAHAGDTLSRLGNPPQQCSNTVPSLACHALAATSPDRTSLQQAMADALKQGRGSYGAARVCKPRQRYTYYVPEHWSTRGCTRVQAEAEEHTGLWRVCGNGFLSCHDPVGADTLANTPFVAFADLLAQRCHFQRQRFLLAGALGHASSA